MTGTEVNQIAMIKQWAAPAEEPCRLMACPVFGCMAPPPRPPQEKTPAKHWGPAHNILASQSLRFQKALLCCEVPGAIVGRRRGRHTCCGALHSNHGRQLRTVTGRSKRTFGRNCTVSNESCRVAIVRALLTALQWVGVLPTDEFFVGERHSRDL